MLKNSPEDLGAPLREFQLLGIRDTLRQGQFECAKSQRAYRVDKKAAHRIMVAAATSAERRRLVRQLVLPVLEW